MQIAYLDCATGISGDMALAALIDAGVDRNAIQDAIASLGIPGVELRVEQTHRCGFRASKVFIDHPPQHTHRHLSDIVVMINGSMVLSPEQKLTAISIFEAIGVAEAHVHGMSLEDVHFHEVGAVDSIADIVGAAVGFSLLGVEKVICSAVPTGRGKIRIAHGVCSIPAPATAEILKGLPIADVDVEAELTTPTGAGIVKVLADEFRSGIPGLRIDRIGYGAGSRDLPGRANILRIIVGELSPSAHTDEVIVLETNLDDVTGEVIGYTRQILLDEGALDVYSTAISMKKNRPGVLLSVIARPVHADRLEEILFRETGTLGIRRRTVQRSVQQRASVAVSTTWGAVSGKISWRDAETPRFTPEFESCAELAERVGKPLLEIYRAAEAAYSFQQSDQATGEIATFEPDLSGIAEHEQHDHDHDGHDHHDHDHDHHGHDHHGHDHRH